MTGTAQGQAPIDLDHGQLVRLDAGDGARVQVLDGAAWVTQEGEPDDAILRAGCDWPLRGGRVLVQGLGPARLRVVGRGLGRARRWSLGVGRGVRRLAARLQLGPAGRGDDRA